VIKITLSIKTPQSALKKETGKEKIKEMYKIANPFKPDMHHAMRTIYLGEHALSVSCARATSRLDQQISFIFAIRSH